ncbi:MAG: endonuclease [Candidatus Eisenbacteria bacterium]
MESRLSSARRARLWGVFLLAALLFIGGSPLAAPPPGYYDTVDTTSAAALRATVHDVIDGHTKIPYTSSSTDTWDVLELADQDPLDSGNILDVYRNRSFDKFGGGNTFYNREHTWPNGYGFPDDGPTNLPYTDCHHLFLCDIGYNSGRGNAVYEWCSAGCGSYPADDYNGESGVNRTRLATPVGFWETWIGRRGDVARAQFYMDVRYEGDAGAEPDLILTDDTALIAASSTGNNEEVAYMGILSTLLQWHQDDPVDDKERARNDVVYTFQGNRNPFIDHPEWVDIVFAGIDTDVASGEAPGPDAGARISAVYPNPFNPRTTLVFFLARPGPARLSVYSVTGALVRTLVDERWESAGERPVSWDGTNDAGAAVSSGVYFARLASGVDVATERLVLVK